VTQSIRALALAAAVVASALAVCSAATAAKKPLRADKHDRALVGQLLRIPALDFEQEDEELTRVAFECPAWKAVGEAEQVDLLFALVVPALLRSIDAFEPQFAQRSELLAKMRPHAAVFKQWLTFVRTDEAQILALARDFDSTGMDICGYLAVVVQNDGSDESADAAYEALVPDPQARAALDRYSVEPSPAEAARRKSVTKRFAAFLRASGFTKKQVEALTG
jgi:hypothetical protein